MGKVEEEYVKKVEALRLLPDDDKQLLLEKTAIGYVHGETILPKLSIFKQLETRQFEAYRYIQSEGPVFYLGIKSQSNLGVFFDREKKLYYGSRYYLTHLNGFVLNIDRCLASVAAAEIGTETFLPGSFAAIESWHSSYGHFRDEVYNLGYFLFSSPDHRDAYALLDYTSGDDFDKVRSNPNLRKIDDLIFAGRSINTHLLGSGLFRLDRLSIVLNGYNARTFHSFPPLIVKKISDRIGRGSPGPKKIFLTRSNSYRDIGNKAEVEDHFALAGFTIINPEDIGFEELVRLGFHAEVVAMYWGSAMTNMVYFARARVIVLKAESYASEDLTLWSRLIANHAIDLTVIESTDNVIKLSDIRSI